MRVRFRLRANDSERSVWSLQARPSPDPQVPNNLAAGVHRSVQPGACFYSAFRIRVATHSLCSAAALVLALFVLGPVGVTLVSELRGQQVAQHLSKLAPEKQHSGQASGLSVANGSSGNGHTAPGVVIDGMTLAAGNAPAVYPSVNQPVTGIIAGELTSSREAAKASAETIASPKPWTGWEPVPSGAVAADVAGVSTKPAAAESVPSATGPVLAGAGLPLVADSDIPLAPHKDTFDVRLRNRYLWRAWMESGAEFHAQRAAGGSLIVYNPGEGYAVMRAAYQPMIQPAPNQDERSIHLDRRESRPAPSDGSSEGEENQQPDETPQYSPRTTSRPQSNDSGISRGRGNSFQPWDSEALANPFGPANALASKVPGLRIERVVLFQGFTSNGYPLDIGRNPFVDTNLGYDVDVGAMATISWGRSRPTSALYLTYTPSYISRMRFPEWSTGDHQLNLNLQKRFKRWNLEAGNNSALRGLQQVLFTPAVLRTVPIPGSLEELAAQAQGGELSSDEIASALTGSPVVESHPKTRYDLGRVLSTSVNAGVTYNYSPRVAATFGVDGSHYRTVSTPETDDKVVGLRPLYRATSLSGTAGMTYQLKPGTKVGANSIVRRNYSSYANSDSVNTMGTIDQRLGRHWSVNGGAGVGTVRAPERIGLEDLPGQSTSSSLVATGGLHYTGRAHKIGIQATRGVGDSVGLGARTSRNASAQWEWLKPGNMWGLYGRAQYYDMSLGGIGLDGSTRGVLGSAGLVRRLSRETTFNVDYSYQSFRSPFRGVVSNLNGHRVQMSWQWRPAGAAR